VRPVVDAHVLGVLAGPLRKREFTEDARGVVRCLAPITHRLAEAMPSYGHTLGPVVETVATMLASSSPYDVKVPTLLSGAKHKAAARKRVDGDRERSSPLPRGPSPTGRLPRGRKRPRVNSTPPSARRACRGCGVGLVVERGRERPRTDWCPSCLPERRGEIGSEMQRASVTEARAFAAATGTLPSHTAEAQAARASANIQQRAEELAWSRERACSRRDGTTPLDGEEAAAWWEREVLSKLAAVTLPAMARATGASTSAASKWRAGRAVPHRRHWQRLAELVGVEMSGHPMIHEPCLVPTVDCPSGTSGQEPKAAQGTLDSQ